MKKLNVLFLLIITNLVFGQVQNEKKYTSSQENYSIVSSVETMPEFPGGNAAFRKKIAENFKEDHVKGNGILTCEIVFVINKEGMIDEIITKGSNESFNMEAKRAVSEIKEKWTPATINGEKVRYSMSVPLTLNYTTYEEPAEKKSIYK